MKHIFFLVLIFFSLTCFSQTNSLVVLSANGNPFLLIVDDSLINKKEEAIVKATGLSTGKHNIEIWHLINGTEIISKFLITIGKDDKFQNKEFTFVVAQEKNNRQALQFKSVSELSGPLTPFIPEAPKEKAPLVDNSIYGNLYQAKNNTPNFYNHYQSATKTCDVNLSDKDLEYAKQLISNCNDSEKQYRYVVEVTKNNCYTCTQYNQLLALLPMDIDKLSASKLAYSHLNDKNNVSQISNCFKYESMKNAFSEFLKQQELEQKQYFDRLSNPKYLTCAEPIEANKFNAFMISLNELKSEYDKWKLSKEFVSKNCINIMQAKEITTTFLHDREKLDFLKSAYQSITDKINAKQLASELQADSDKEEYLQFISK